jgi:hypothetical protein
MKATTTKKIFTFILLLSGMFSFSIAEAQLTCDCAHGQVGYCAADNHGNIKCHKVHFPDGWRVGGNGMTEASREASLKGVTPNPVSYSTVISFSTEQSQKVSLKIFDTNGRLITTLANSSFEEGNHEIVWNADVNAGIYFLQFQTEENSEMTKLVVTK